MDGYGIRRVIGSLHYRRDSCRYAPIRVSAARPRTIFLRGSGGGTEKHFGIILSTGITVDRWSFFIGSRCHSFYRFAAGRLGSQSLCFRTAITLPDDVSGTVCYLESSGRIKIRQNSCVQMPGIFERVNWCRADTYSCRIVARSCCRRFYDFKFDWLEFCHSHGLDFIEGYIAFFDGKRNETDSLWPVFHDNPTRRFTSKKQRYVHHRSISWPIICSHLRISPKSFRIARTSTPRSFCIGISNYGEAGNATEF